MTKVVPYDARRLKKGFKLSQGSTDNSILTLSNRYFGFAYSWNIVTGFSYKYRMIISNQVNFQ